jgi:xanthine dehydrogenase YagT iron-sulfur-binding subunit
VRRRVSLHFARAGEGASVKASITLRVDGEQRSLAIDTRTTLLDALGEHLGITGHDRRDDHGIVHGAS